MAENKSASDEALGRFLKLARDDPSPVVRLYLAAAMQRTPVEKRWDIVIALNQHAEDAGDHNLPLMNWYAAEPLVTNNLSRAMALSMDSKFPRMLEFAARRAAALGTTEAFAEITSTFGQTKDDARRLEILTGLTLALKGQRTAPMPAGWEKVEATTSDNAAVRTQIEALSLKFGSPAALAALRSTLMNRSVDTGPRRTAMSSLLDANDRDLAPVLRQLLTEPDLRDAALRGLAAYDDPQTATAILKVYPELNEAQRRSALNTLAARKGSAGELLSAVEAGTVPLRDLTADLVRQLRGLQDADLAQKVQKLWGTYRDSSADKQAEIRKYRDIYRAGGSLPGEAPPGRAIFNRICSQCHTLFDTGGKVGPDLTGSNRRDLDYILQNIIDPNAVIPNEYRAANVETRDNRSLTGIIKQQDDKSVTLATANETITLPRGEIKSIQQSELSMMPEGLLQPLSDQEVRDLIYYLSRPGQVPLPASEASVSTPTTGK